MGGTPQTQDIAILNYALQLSYLSAAFYQMAAFGRQIPADLRGGGPEATGGRKGQYTPQVCIGHRDGVCNLLLI